MPCKHINVPVVLPPQVCKYIDIPLQHISNLTLLGMNRPPQAHTLALLHKLRDRIPGLALRTTFISGFPGGQYGIGGRRRGGKEGEKVVCCVWRQLQGRLA